MARLAILAALLASGCTTALPSATRLDGTRWQVEAINRQPVPRTPQYAIEFKAGRIAGRLGCNSFSGDYRQSQGTLTTGPVAATEMACPEPGMTHEGLGFNILQRPMRMNWRGDAGLTLSNEAGSIEMARSY